MKVFFKIQGTRSGAIVAPNKFLEQVLSLQSRKVDVRIMETLNL